MNFKKILSAIVNPKTHWDYYKLYINLTKWSSQGILPYASSLPDRISLTSQFWSKVKELHQLTLADEHERAVGVWWIDGDICITPNQRGERSSVTSQYSLRVGYFPQQDPKYYTKQVEVDSKVIFSKTVGVSEIPEKSVISSLFNLHTHPPHYNELDGKKHRYYHFFSRTDIGSLISGDTLISGVITDEVYLLFKTNQTPRYLPDHIQDRTITPELLFSDLGLVQYKGSWSTAVFDKVTFN